MKKRYYIILALLTVLGTATANAQTQDSPESLLPPEMVDKFQIRPYNLVDTVIENGETIPYVHIRPIVKYRRAIDARRYERLVRNLKVVYPIALFANYRLQEMEKHLLTIHDKRKQQAYIKQVEKELKEQYTPILKRMSFSQGKLLIKLIDRQTGRTSYDLVKELRGSFRAFFWQGVARIFGANLKDMYDKEGEDRIIEQLIVMYEAGEL